MLEIYRITYMHLKWKKCWRIFGETLDYSKTTLIWLPGQKNFVMDCLVLMIWCADDRSSLSLVGSVLDVKFGCVLDIKTKYLKKILLQWFPLSRFRAKNLKVNKLAVKEFLKNLSFGVFVKLYVPPLTYKKLTHITWVMWEARP